MSDADHRNVALVQQGVTLEKSLNTEDFAVPTVVFTIRGPPEARTTVRVRDPVPEPIESSDIGFHPNHGGEFWTFEGDHVVFSREFEPGEEYTTVYGIIGADGEDRDVLSAEPSVEVSGRGGASPSAAAASGDAQPTDESPDRPSSKVLVQLAEELEGGTAPELRRIREALFEGEAADASRLDELRREVDDLAARTASIEAESLDGLEATLASVEERLAELEERVDEPRDGFDADGFTPSDEADRTDLERELEQVTTGMERNARDIDDIGAEVTELATTVESVLAERNATIEDEDLPADLEASIAAIEDDLDTVRGFQERLTTTLLECRSR